MKSVAILNPEIAPALADFLGKEQIQCVTRAATDENGLEVTEVLVEDDRYEQACDASERWQEEVAAQTQARARRPCPKCRAPQALERVQDARYEEAELVVLRCRECGEVFAL